VRPSTDQDYGKIRSRLTGKVRRLRYLIKVPSAMACFRLAAARSSETCRLLMPHRHGNSESATLRRLRLRVRTTCLLCVPPPSVEAQINHPDLDPVNILALPPPSRCNRLLSGPGTRATWDLECECDQETAIVSPKIETRTKVPQLTRLPGQRLQALSFPHPVRLSPDLHSDQPSRQREHLSIAHLVQDRVSRTI
jgi:hypothetical protein